MKKYFVYQLKKNLLSLACLTLFCIIMYVLPISMENYSYWNNTTGEYFYYYNPSLYYSTITVALGIMSVFIPIVMFAYKMNRRSVDMHYSLPISKTKILAVNFLIGLILMYASYSIAYLLGFILIAIKTRRLYLIYYLYLYLASLIPAFITYAVTAFIFTRANTIIDGVISVASTLCILALAAATVIDICSAPHYSHYASNYATWGDGYYFFPFTPLSQTASILGGAIISGNVSKWFDTSNRWDYNIDICRLVSSIVWTVIAMAATVMLFVFEKRSKAEHCGQITESWFCYKVQIPAYMVMFVALAADSGGVASIMVIAFGIFIWSIIYKRSIKIGWKLAVVLIACIIGGLILRSLSTPIFKAIYGVKF